MPKASRRRFLLVVGGGMAALAGGCAKGDRQTKEGLVAMNLQLGALIATGHFSADVGGMYLETAGLPANGTFATLHTEVTRDLGKQDGDLLEEIRWRMKKDFAQGRTCRLDGWTLSVTECQLAGLAFLFKEAGGHIEEPAAGPASPISGLDEAPIAEVENWGPRFGAVGEGFNLQPDGTSAFWFRFADISQHPYQIYFGVSPLRTSVVGDQDLITATVTRKQVEHSSARPGEIPVYLVDMLNDSKQLVGHFRVQPPSGRD